MDLAPPTPTRHSIQGANEMEKDHKIDSLETELRQWRRENEDLRLELENTKATHRMEMDKLELSQKKKLTDRNESLKLLKTKNTETLQAKSSLEAKIKKLQTEVDTFQEEREKFNGELKKVKEEKAKVHSERDRQKIAFKEKEAKIMTKGAKTKAKIQVLQSELQKALCAKEEFRMQIHELEQLIRDIHPKDVEKHHARIRLQERKDKEKQSIRMLEQLLAESEETEKLHLEEKRILREEMNFLRKTLTDQQKTSELHLQLNAPSPTPHLSQNEQEKNGAPPPIPQRQSISDSSETENSITFWVCWGGRKAKVSISSERDVDDLRALICKNFSLENPALFDVVQIPHFLDPSVSVSKISYSSMIFLVHSNTRVALGDEECIHQAERKVELFLKGETPGDDEPIKSFPKLQLPPIHFLFGEDEEDGEEKGFSELYPPPSFSSPLEWPVPPFPGPLKVPKWENSISDPPRPPPLPKWLQDGTPSDEQLEQLKECLFNVQLLLKNSEDSEQIHVEQERTLRREVELMRKEIEVLKYEIDLDLPCLRNCIVRMLLCQKMEEMEQILPVVSNILQCSPSDMEKVKRAFEQRKNIISVYGVTVFGGVGQPATTSSGPNVPV